MDLVGFRTGYVELLAPSKRNHYYSDMMASTSSNSGLRNSPAQGANKLQEHIKPNEQATEVPASVQKGVHYTRKASEYVVGVSDFLMTSLARLTVKVGSGIKEKVEESEVRSGEGGS